MSKVQIRRPIGLDNICQEIENNCQKAHVFKYNLTKPKHLLVPLDSGSGRTTILEYMVEMYKHYAVLDFKCGLDDYLEISFDGTYAQVREAFLEIDSAAIYANAYSNIVGMDVSKVALHLNETQYEDFISEAKRVCKDATVVFFFPSTPNRNELILMRKISENIENSKYIDIEPYTASDLQAISIVILENNGIEIEEKEKFLKAISYFQEKALLLEIKDATKLAEDLVLFADFSGNTPRIDDKAVIKVMRNWGNTHERTGVR